MEDNHDEQTEVIAPTEAVTEPAETPAEESARPSLDRDNFMEQLAESRRVAMETELGISTDDDKPQEQPVPVATPVPVDDQIAAQLLDTDQFDKTRVKVKVDGVESEVSIAEMVRSFQKESAATHRLEEASRLLREAKASTQEQPAPAATPTPATDAKPNVAPGLKEFINAVYEGDEERAAELFGTMMGGATAKAEAPTLNVNEIAAQVEQQIQVKSALAQFGKDFTEIAGNPYLQQIADGYLGEELASGKHPSFNAALTASGNRVRDWVRDTAAQITPAVASPTTTRQEKLERKASVTPIKVAAGISASASEEKPQSASDVIAEMRRQRGQAA
jgi:hypothetical protein